MGKLHRHGADSTRCTDDDNPLFCMQLQRIYRRVSHQTRNSTCRGGSERKGTRLLRNPSLINGTEFCPCPSGAECHLHAEYGFANLDRAHGLSDCDDDSRKIATRCHRSIRPRAFADGNASVECPFGNVDIVDVDGGSVNLYEHFMSTRHRLSDFHHLQNVRKGTGRRPSR